MSQLLSWQVHDPAFPTIPATGELRVGFELDKDLATGSYKAGKGGGIRGLVVLTGRQGVWGSGHLLS